MSERKKVKIVFVIDRLPSDRAGTERQFLYIIRGLNPSLFDIHLVCLQKNDWFEKNRQDLPCKTYVKEIYKFKKISTYCNIVSLLLMIKKIKPDIVHSFFPTSNVVGSIVAIIGGVNTILSSRRDYGQWVTPLSLGLTKIANIFITRITTNSINVKQFTFEKESVNLQKIDVLYNGIDLNRFNATGNVNHNIKPSLNISENEKIVGVVANLRPMKHLDTFIKAAFEILKVRTDISFLLIGDGPSRQYLENLVKELGIDSKVHFVGSQEDVPSFLEIIDVGVNCSAQEGLSNAIMEYMAAGLPCVVAGAGGNDELIENEKNGFIFRLDNYYELSTKILTLIENDKLREQFKFNSKKKVQQLFSLDKMIENYENYYREFVNL